jgi:DNA-binding NarL/FixJ family response regulator
MRVSGNAFHCATERQLGISGDSRTQAAKQEIRRLNGALDILSKPFPGHETLTPKERVALAQIIRGASSKEAGRTLGISPPTVDFH